MFFFEKKKRTPKFVAALVFTTALFAFFFRADVADSEPLVRGCATADSMENAGRSSGTDKILRHGYHRYLQPHLTSLCFSWEKKGAALLEIGINTGKSLSMWTASMPGWFVYGMDIHKQVKEPGITVFQADQSSIGDLHKVLASISHPVPIVNDDGSHVPQHQLLAFNVFFSSLLQPGGVYFIEDIETSYWTGGSIYGYNTPFGFRNKDTPIELFKAAADVVNREFLIPSSLEGLIKSTGGCDKEEDEQRLQIESGLQQNFCHGIWPTALGLISSITFGPNLIIITKRSSNDKNYDRLWKAYKYPQMLSRDPNDLRSPEG